MNYPPPPLLFISKHRLSSSAVEAFDAAYKAWVGTGKSLVVEDMEVFQLIDGKWCHLGAGRPATEGEISGGVIVGESS